MSRDKYRVPYHVMVYVEKELRDYKDSKKLIKEFDGETVSTREFLLALKRVQAIDKVFKNLSSEDKEATEIIFFEGISQPKAEFSGISKTAYYYAKDKVIYLVARKMNLV